MTPKEKAQNLLFYFENEHSNKISDYSRVYTPTAKIFAKKVCEEIIQLPCMTDENWLTLPDEYKIAYWKEVIQEIELL